MRADIDSLAQKIVERRLELPALLFLEMHLPLVTLAHTSTLFLSPLLSPVFGAERFHHFSQLLSSREHIEALIEKIRKLSEERDGER